MDFQAALSMDIENIPYSESFVEFETQYKCFQVIGEGGFGKVRNAVQLCDQKNVAIKFVADKKITSWHYHQKLNKRIPMEIALMCRCREVSGVIKIIKYFQIKEHKGWYIVMERFERFVDLFDYITNEGHLKEKMAAHFLTQLLTIVMDCHDRGVCHRDIKDENIVINLDSMKIYLIDFGAGGFFNTGIYKDFDGTRVYSPPEWIQFKQYRASSLEVWSLGILLFDMVCGNLPFDNDESIVNGLFQYRRMVSGPCQDLIQKCLQYEPGMRIEMSDIIHHHWFTLHSKMTTLERMKRSTTSTLHQECTSSTNGSSCTEDNSRRVSLETSPFTTPQSSGLDDDSHYLQEVSSSVSPISSSSSSSALFTQQPSHFLLLTKHNNNNNNKYTNHSLLRTTSTNTFSVTNFRKV